MSNFVFLFAEVFSDPREIDLGQIVACGSDLEDVLDTAFNANISDIQLPSSRGRNLPFVQPNVDDRFWVESRQTAFNHKGGEAAVKTPAGSCDVGVIERA